MEWIIYYALLHRKKEKALPPKFHALFGQQLEDGADKWGKTPGNVLSVVGHAQIFLTYAKKEVYPGPYTCGITESFYPTGYTDGIRKMPIVFNKYPSCPRKPSLSGIIGSDSPLC